MHQQSVPPKEFQVESNKSENDYLIHCSFCFRSILCAKDIKTCGKCHRRRYCGKECQAKDWTRKINKKGEGQGHSDWCGISYGEEGIDWEIKLVPGKGRGIISKRNLPPNYRIMVDGYTNLACGREEGSSVLLNHSCDANACKTMDMDFEVFIIVSKRDIEVGEEILVNYTFYSELCFNLLPNQFKLIRKLPQLNSLSECRKLLESNWKIICLPDCYCRINNEDVDNVVAEVKNLCAGVKFENYSLGGPYMYTKKDVGNDLIILHKLLENYEKLKSGPGNKAKILEVAFRVSILAENSANLGNGFIKEAYEIMNSIVHPSAGILKTYKDWLDDPKSAKHYLALEPNKGMVMTP